jgi:hypothetical protein
MKRGIDGEQVMGWALGTLLIAFLAMLIVWFSFNIYIDIAHRLGS